jgi:hypothetical protein
MRGLDRLRQSEVIRAATELKQPSWHSIRGLE